MGRFFSWDEFVSVFPRIVACIPTTLWITFSSFAAGAALAVLIAMARLYRVPVLNQLSAVYVSFMRGTPILIQLLICNIAMPGLIYSLTGINVGRKWPPIAFVVIAYALNSAAFLSEIFRAAVSGVEAGQSEAAYAAGMTRAQSFFHVVFPQAVRIALPSVANSLSGLLKDTSLAYSAAGILDVMGMVTASAARTFRYLEGYVGAAIVFFGLCLLLEVGFHILTKRTRYASRTSASKSLSGALQGEAAS